QHVPFLPAITWLPVSATGFLVSWCTSCTRYERVTLSGAALATASISSAIEGYGDGCRKPRARSPTPPASTSVPGPVAAGAGCPGTGGYPGYVGARRPGVEGVAATRGEARALVGGLGLEIGSVVSGWSASPHAASAATTIDTPATRAHTCQV